MTEQEYCDLTDLQLARTILAVTRQMNCFDIPLSAMRDEIRKQANLIIGHLEPIVSENVD